MHTPSVTHALEKVLWSMRFLGFTEDLAGRSAQQTP